jgi:uncharacterized protein (DUF1778 family)
MPKSEKKKGGGSKLNRTQTVTLRLDPKLRYLTDLAARSQRRTTSGFIEWAIEEALSKVVLLQLKDRTLTLKDKASALWDVDEPDRFAKLAIKYPNLLTHDEQVLWKLILEISLFWTVFFEDSDDPVITDSSLDFKLLREHWDTLKAVAEGRSDISNLKIKPRKGPKIIASEIPF